VEPFPLPLFELLENADPWLAVFECVSLYDAELHAVRIDIESSLSVEIDLYLPGAFAVAGPVERRAHEYCITVRCTGVSAVHAEDTATGERIAAETLISIARIHTHRSLCARDRPRAQRLRTRRVDR
jgi:hypothetical protein